MTVLLHLVRHGQTSWNAVRRIQGQAESELDDLGRQQAGQVGERLRGLTFDAIHCSTSIRTRQTLQIMLAGSTPDVSYRDDLREMCFGEWEGELWDDIERRHPEMVRRFRASSPDYAVPGAETHAQLQARGVAAIEAILASHGQEHGNVLIVSHGALIKRILAAYAAIDLASRSDLPPLHNCSHSILSVTEDQRRLIQVADKPVEQTNWASGSPC